MGLFERQLYEMMNQIANMLKDHNVKKGDRVAIYMPTCPMTVATMLACTRIGAIHSVVFAGFSAESLASRINDCLFEFLIQKYAILILNWYCFNVKLNAVSYLQRIKV
jgi:acyl-coenzyme A synthetase/AMP-(fatty) acid ligase